MAASPDTFMATNFIVCNFKNLVQLKQSSLNAIVLHATTGVSIAVLAKCVAIDMRLN